MVELPGAKDVERIQNLLQSTAQLEFWETFKNDELLTFISDADQYLSTLELENNESNVDASDIDDLLSEVEQSSDSIQNSSNPLIKLVKAFSFQGGPIIARFLPRDQAVSYTHLTLPTTPYV